jgi:hypothetical protein
MPDDPIPTAPEPAPAPVPAPAPERTNVLHGVGFPPVLVGLARGLAEAMVLAALGAAAVFIADADLGDKAWLGPIIWAGIRTAEGWADQIDPTKRRREEDSV